jgi:hypothetical protein
MPKPPRVAASAPQPATGPWDQERGADDGHADPGRVAVDQQHHVHRVLTEPVAEASNKSGHHEGAGKVEEQERAQRHACDPGDGEHDGGGDAGQEGGGHGDP